MNVRVILASLSVVLLASACGGRDPDLIGRVPASGGRTYETPAEVADRLDLPAPGIDHSNRISVVDYPDEQMFELTVGPISLDAGTPHVLLPNAVTSFPFDFVLTGYDWSITDAEYNPLPSDLLHHFNIINPARRELFYPIAQRLFAAGSETPGATMPPLAGVPVAGNNPLIVVSMFANPTQTDYPDAYFRLWITYRRGNDPRVELHPFYLDAAGPIPPQDFEVPPGETVVESEASPAVRGRILGIGGHLHDYGTFLEVRDRTKPALVWRAEPESTDGGHVVSMPTSVFLAPWRGRLLPDDTYVVRARYDNPMDVSSPAMGMGAIGGVFTTDATEPWYEPDRSDPVWRDDMVMTLSAPLYHDWRSLTPEEMRRRIRNRSDDVNESGG